MPPEPLILAFDTSVAHCAAALLCGDRVLAERVEEMTRGQVERLFPLIEEMLTGAGFSWKNLNAIGVGIGPGNFTGIRISVSAARGLALSLGVPAIGVSSLSAQAEGAARPLVSVLDARRDNVYVQVFGPVKDGKPQFCTIDSLPDLSDLTAATIVGFRAEKIAASYGAKVAQPRFPIAVAIGRIALTQIGADTPRPAPLYLRAADAAPPRDPAPTLLS